jgi:hypothetical protein
MMKNAPTAIRAPRAGFEHGTARVVPDVRHDMRR